LTAPGTSTSPQVVLESVGGENGNMFATLCYVVN
jgi:hypothetical protein